MGGECGALTNTDMAKDSLAERTLGVLSTIERTGKGHCTIFLFGDKYGK